MNTSMAYIFAILFLVVALNLFFVLRRIRQTSNKYNKKRSQHIPHDEAKQAIWRDKEIARRVAREHDDAYERHALRNETLAYYETVRKRHTKKESLERLGLNTDGNLDDLKSLGLEEYLNKDTSENGD